MYVIKEKGMIVPAKIWGNESKGIDENVWEQMKNICFLPFVFKHASFMPDFHLGSGCPIGGVVALKNAVSPAIVGVDIGCGMCAVKTSLTEIDEETLKKILGEIRKVIPLGFNKHKEAQDKDLMPEWKDEISRISIIEKEYKNALNSLGTLGGGNHFIEIQKGSDGYIWIMLHSGSRNLGFKVAQHYNKVAQDLNTKWYSKVPPFKGEDGLAFLPVDSKEGQAYISEMNYCVDYALANRKLMMDRILSVFLGTLGSKEHDKFVGFIKENEMINIAHNYASLENHFGQNVWVHRKGATKATKGLKGIIPGSMGTSSYIVEGLGNRESFMSCSHGAGRKMSRSEAKRTLSLEKEQAKMKGILGKPRSQEDLDEAPGSYKSIDEVMSNQSDLIKILVELTPLANIKR